MAEINKHSREAVDGEALEASRRLAGVESSLSPEQQESYHQESELARQLATVNNQAINDVFPSSARYNDYYLQQAQNRVDQLFGLELAA